MKIATESVIDSPVNPVEAPPGSSVELDPSRKKKTKCWLFPSIEEKEYRKEYRIKRI